MDTTALLSLSPRLSAVLILGEVMCELAELASCVLKIVMSVLISMLMNNPSSIMAVDLFTYQLKDLLMNEFHILHTADRSGPSNQNQDKYFE